MTSFAVTDFSTTSETLEGGQNGIVASTGTIYKEFLVAVSFTSGNPDLINLGSIIAQSSQAISSTSDSGTNDISNYGIISGTSGAITFSLGATLNLFNAGTVEGVGPAEAVSLRTGSSLTLNNSGTIVSQANAIDAASTAGFATIDNTGSILGDIVLANLSDTIVNTGHIFGDIVMGGGSDTFDTRQGQFTGIVSGGAGDDTYLINDGSTIISEFMGDGTDEVHVAESYSLSGTQIENLTLTGTGDARGFGSAAANVLTGSAGDNRLGGSGGDDTVDGGFGNDQLYGGGGNDTLTGGEGDDYLSGGAGGDNILGGDDEDQLFGRRGADTLNGGDGADILHGGDGSDLVLGGRDEDTLIGGAGADQLNGGGGIDTFVWNSASESTNDSGRDVINGYEVGLDVLDLSALGITDINIGGGLSGGGVGSARTFETSGGDTRIYADVDGDGSTDMRVDIIGVLGITGSDFLI